MKDIFDCTEEEKAARKARRKQLRSQIKQNLGLPEVITLDDVVNAVDDICTHPIA